MFNYNGYNNYMPRYTPQYQPYNSNMQNYQSQVQPQMQPQVQPQAQPVTIQGLQGKNVDSIDVVKATDIPLDGSISYFPLTDGSAIITKQLQTDGTSKTLIYKPINSVEEQKNNYITSDELKEHLKNVNSKEIKDIKEELKSLKREIRDLSDDLKDKKEE